MITIPPRLGDGVARMPGAPGRNVPLPRVGAEPCVPLGVGDVVLDLPTRWRAGPTPVDRIPAIALSPWLALLPLDDAAEALRLMSRFMEQEMVPLKRL